MAYLKEIPVFEHAELNDLGISKKSLQSEGISTSSLNTLIKNKIFVIEKEIFLKRLTSSRR